MGRGDRRDRNRSRSPSNRNSGPRSESSRFGNRSPVRGRNRFDGPGSSRFSPQTRFDGPPGPPGRFDGAASRFDGPPGRFEGPPPIFPPGAEPPIELAPGNDVEIIVVNKEQWGYAEMIEGRLRSETPIKYIDLLFLHHPQHISVTLSDLFERQTLYAIVVTPSHQEHRSCTVHILHTQTEHRNISVDEAIPLIDMDFAAYMGRGSGSGPGEQPYGPGGAPTASPFPPTGPSTGPYSAPAPVGILGPSTKRLPDDIEYLLRTILSEGGVQFLSLQQIDSVIDFFKLERNRLTSSSSSTSLGNSVGSNVPTVSGYQSANNVPLNPSSTSTLLENPTVKAALNSLLQIGAISNTTNDNRGTTSTLSYSSYSTSSAGNSFSNSGPGVAGGTFANPPSYLSTSTPNTPSSQSNSNNQTRRHPLMGTEISSSPVNSGYSSYSSRNQPSNSNRGYTSSNARY